jgi:hypothetical protein
VHIPIQEQLRFLTACLYHYRGNTLTIAERKGEMQDKDFICTKFDRMKDLFNCAFPNNIRAYNTLKQHAKQGILGVLSIRLERDTKTR